jgi:hypothetical protein
VVQVAGRGAEGHVRLGAFEFLLEFVHGDGGGSDGLYQTAMAVWSAAAVGDSQVEGHVHILVGDSARACLAGESLSNARGSRPDHECIARRSPRSVQGLAAVPEAVRHYFTIWSGIKVG